MTNNESPRFTTEDQSFLQNVVEPLKKPEKPSQEIIFLGGGLTPIRPNPDLTEGQKQELQEKERNIRQHKS